MIDWLFIFGIELCILVLVIWIAWSAIVGAPWLPTPKKKVRYMLEFARVNKDDRLYDLGSGDGRIIVMAAKEFGVKATGIEIDPIRLLWSRFKIRRHRIESMANVIRANFFDVNVGDATIVTLYQGFEINKKIRDKLSTELRPGSRVVSYRFIVDGWTPTEVDEEESVYLYVR